MMKTHIDSSFSCTFLNVTDTKNCSVCRCIITGVFTWSFTRAHPFMTILPLICAIFFKTLVVGLDEVRTHDLLLGRLVHSQLS